MGKRGIRIIGTLILTVFCCFLLKQQALADTEEWTLTADPQTELDTIVSEVRDQTNKNKLYYVGYRNGKVAVMNDKYQLIAQTAYDKVYAEYLNTISQWDTAINDERPENLANTYYKGKMALVVKKGKYYGLCDLWGRELLPCEYVSISYSENLEGHGIYKLQNKKFKTSTWLDGRVKLDGGGEYYLFRYKGKIYVGHGVYNSKKEKWEFFHYDLNGKYLGPEPEDDPSPSDMMGSTEDLYWFREAKNGWLSEKVEDAKASVTSYYESAGYTVSDVETDMAFNYIHERENPMYYYLLVQVDLSMPRGNGLTDHLGTFHYLYVYHSDKSLYLEGQTNLTLNDCAIDHGAMLDVLLLDPEGNVQRMDRYTGQLETIYKVQMPALWCGSLGSYNEDVLERHQITGIAEIKEYTEEYEIDLKKDIRSYTLEYTKQYLFLFGTEENVYVIPTGERLHYDWHVDQAVFGVAEGEEQVQLYLVTDRLCKSACLNLSLKQLQMYRTDCRQAGDGYILLVNALQEVLALDANRALFLSYKELGIEESAVSFISAPVTSWGDLVLVCLENDNLNFGSDSRFHYYTYLIDRSTTNWKQIASGNSRPAIVGNGLDRSIISGNTLYYLKASNLLYLIDTKELTVIERNLQEQLDSSQGIRVLDLQLIRGNVYIHYLDSSNPYRTYYGYMDTEGKAVVDAKTSGICMEESEDHWNLTHQYLKANDYITANVYGDYTLIGTNLYDADFQLLSKKMYWYNMVCFDREKGTFLPSGMISVFNRYLHSDQFIGFLYDTEKNEVLWEYSSYDEAYNDIQRYGQYDILHLAKSGGFVCYDRNTHEFLFRADSGYLLMDRSNRRLIAFADKEKSKKVLLKKGCTYSYKDSVYQITDVKKKTVTLFQGATNLKVLRIPDTVTIGGQKFKVTAIAAKACQGNKKLTKVTLGKYVKKIGKDAFAGCSNLKTKVKVKK